MVAFAVFSKRLLRHEASDSAQIARIDLAPGTAQSWELILDQIGNECNDLFEHICSLLFSLLFVLISTTRDVNPRASD